MSEECEHKIHCHVVENSVEGGWGAIDATGSRGRWSVEDLTYETGATPHVMRSIESRPRWKALHWMLSLNYWTCPATMRKTADTHKQEKFKASRAMNEQTKAMQIKKKLLLEKIKENRLKRGLPNQLHNCGKGHPRTRCLKIIPSLSQKENRA